MYPSFCVTCTQLKGVKVPNSVFALTFNCWFNQYFV